MGLDMYLTAKRYLSPYDADQKVLAEKIGTIPELKNGLMRVKEVSCDMMYWRKANAIHSWFVKNVQDDTDDCGSYWVSAEQLIQLRKECELAWKHKDQAATILPTKEGFFFGSTEIDDGYFQDISETIFALDKVEQLEEDGWDFYYSSSW